MSTRTKGKIAFFLGLFLIFGLGYHFFGRQKKLDTHGEAYYALDLEDGRVRLKGNEREKRSPGSLVKGMTALVAIEKIEDWEEKVPIDVASYKRMVQENASMAGFYGRERVTYRDLLYGMLLSSGGECAETLAISLGKNEGDFVVEMNRKAQDLGMKNTQFKNPTGMDQEGQYTTAEDMGLLYQAVFTNKNLRKILTTTNYRSSKTLDHPEGLNILSTVLSSLEEGDREKILGGKSGTTEKGGKSWACLVRKKDKDYVTVVMGTDLKSPGYDQVREDTLKLLENM